MYVQFTSCVDWEGDWEANVTQKDLEQIILDTEIIQENRSMMYTDDDIHLISSVNTKYTTRWTTYSNPRKPTRER